MIAPDVGGGFGAKIGAVPRGAAAGRGWPSASAGRCAGSRPAPRTWSASATAAARCRRHESAARRDGKRQRLPPRRAAGLRAPTRASARVLPVHDPDRWRRASTPSPKIECTSKSVVTNTTPSSGLPRRRPARGHRGDRAGHGPVRGRDRHGPGRGAPPQPDPGSTRSRTRPRPARPTTSATTRARSTWRSTRPATPSCGPSRPRGATRATSVQLGIGVSRLRRDHRRARRRARRVRQGRGPARRHAPPSTPARRRTARATHRLVDDRQRARPASRWTDIDVVARRHRPRARRATAPWARARCSRAARPCTQAAIELVERGPERGRRPARGRPPTTSCSTTAAGAFHVAGTPAVARTWADLARPRRWPTPRRAARAGRDQTFTAAAPTFPFGAHVAVVEVDTETGQVPLARHRRLRRRRPRPQPAAGRGPAPRRHRPGRGPGAAGGGPLRRRRQPDHVELRRLRLHLRRRAAHRSSSSTMETPTPVNPLGAKGIGESGTIGSTPAVQTRGRRRAGATSASATSTCRPRPSGSGSAIVSAGAERPELNQPRRHGVASCDRRRLRRKSFDAEVRQDRARGGGRRHHPGRCGLLLVLPP